MVMVIRRTLSEGKWLCWKEMFQRCYGLDRKYPPKTNVEGLDSNAGIFKDKDFGK